MIKEEKQVKALQKQLALAEAVQKIRSELKEKDSTPNAESVYNVQRRKDSYGHYFSADMNEQNNEPKMNESEMIKTLLEYVDVLENQLELENFDKMMEMRKGDTGFLSGNALEDEATQLFNDNEAEIRRLLDGGK